MKLLIFSDIHSDRAALQRLMDVEADHYVAAGDLVNWARGLDAVGEVLRRRTERMHVLPGNHENEAQIDDFCAKNGFSALHGRCFEASGWHVAGLGHSSPTPFHTPGEYSEEEMAARLAPFESLERLILICHCPPLGTVLDEAAPGKHFGSRSVREFIERKQPEWFFCGHIHEAAGRWAQLGRTRGLNVGKAGYLLEL